MVSIKVEYKASKSVTEIEKTLRNFSAYPEWWREYKTRCIDEMIVFQPLPFIKIKIKPSIVDNVTLRFEYLESPILGYGIWETHDDAPGTTVSYTIYLSGNTWFTNKLIGSILFKWKHRRDIIRLMKRLDSFPPS